MPNLSPVEKKYETHTGERTPYKDRDIIMYECDRRQPDRIESGEQGATVECTIQER